MTTDYEQFGPEWEKEISKLPKKVLISMLKAKAIKILELEELKNKLKKIAERRPCTCPDSKSWGPGGRMDFSVTIVKNL